MASRPESHNSSLSPHSFSVGDRVEFVRESNPHRAADDAEGYEPVVPAGSRALVVNVGADHIRVVLEDRTISSEPLVIWSDDAFPDAVTNKLSSLKKL
jgi:hypothetical protein